MAQHLGHRLDPPALFILHTRIQEKSSSHECSTLLSGLCFTRLWTTTLFRNMWLHWSSTCWRWHFLSQTQLISPLRYVHQFANCKVTFEWLLVLNDLFYYQTSFNKFCVHFAAENVTTDGIDQIHHCVYSIVKTNLLHNKIILNYARIWRHPYRICSNDI